MPTCCLVELYQDTARYDSAGNRLRSPVDASLEAGRQLHQCRLPERSGNLDHPLSAVRMDYGAGAFRSIPVWFRPHWNWRRTVATGTFADGTSLRCDGYPNPPGYQLLCELRDAERAGDRGDGAGESDRERLTRRRSSSPFSRSLISRLRAFDTSRFEFALQTREGRLR